MMRISRRTFLQSMVTFAAAPLVAEVSPFVARVASPQAGGFVYGYESAFLHYLRSGEIREPLVRQQIGDEEFVLLPGAWRPAIRRQVLEISELANGLTWVEMLPPAETPAPFMVDQVTILAHVMFSEFGVSRELLAELPSIFNLAIEYQESVAWGWEQGLEATVWEGDGKGKPLGLLQQLGGERSGLLRQGINFKICCNADAWYNEHNPYLRANMARWVCMDYAGDDEIVAGDLHAYTVAYAPLMYMRRWADECISNWVRIVTAIQWGGALMYPDRLCRLNSW